MDENDKKKTVKDLVKAFDSNPKKESNLSNTNTITKTNTKKEKVPLFPTLKKLPNSVNNEYTHTSDKNQVKNLDNSSKNKPQTNPDNSFKNKPQTNPDNSTKNKPQTNTNNTNKNRAQTNMKVEKPEEKEDPDKNPFAFFWKKTKKEKVKDDSNLLDKIDTLNINPEEEKPEPKKRRNSSYNKKKETKKIEMFPDNPEQAIGDSSDADDPVVPLTYKETEELLKDPKFANVKELKQYTDSEISKTVTDKSKSRINIVKSLVSQDKTRFCYDGFDLDLTYITTRIIAMGFPSSSIEGIYRNNMEDVKEFFEKRHPNHYKVYNLCDDKKYAPNCFYRQGHFPFKDHEAPPLNLIRPFCEDAKKFLDEDKENVVSIHCKAGKGRTGTFICCLLLYMKFFETADECLLYYGLMRVGTVKGVTVPSQIRYVHYFESILKNNIPHPITFKKIVIRNVKMYTIPKVGKKKFTPLFSIENQGKVVKYSEINKKKDTYTITNFDLPFIEFPMNVGGQTVCGDVRFLFYQSQLLKTEKMFKFWFNTNFLPQNGLYEIKKEQIDKACKDKKCKVYKENFKIEIEYIFI